MRPIYSSPSFRRKSIRSPGQRGEGFRRVHKGGQIVQSRIPGQNVGMSRELAAYLKRVRKNKQRARRQRRRGRR